MYIDSLKVLNYFIIVPQKNEGSIPVTLNYFHDSKFIQMTPKTVLSEVVNGVVIIRFAVAIKRSDILWDIIKLNDQNAFNIDGEIIDRKNYKFYSNIGKIQKVYFPLHSILYFLDGNTRLC